MGKVVLVEALEDRTLFTRAVGIDVSNYQGEPNWTSVASSGVQFAYAKATQGSSFVDADFSYNITNGTAAGVVMGAYDFADFTVDPTTEAEHFLSVAGSSVGAGYLLPMVDCETNNANDNASQITSWVNTWCDTVYADTGVKPIIYTDISFAADYFQSSVTQWPLWMANPNTSGSQTGGPNGTAPWPTWNLWQWGQEDVSGISGEVDQDVANGDMTTYVIPNLVGASTQFTPGESVHVNATDGLKAWNTYASNGTYVTEPNNTNGVIEGNPVYIDGYLRFPIEYAGSSTVTWSAGAYLSPGGVPVVNSVNASPNPAALSSPIKLTASVSDPDSTVSSVSFYLETNGTSGLQTGSGGDTLVGTATSGSAGKWSVNITSPSAVGTYTYYAVATDASGISSTAGVGSCIVTTSSILNPGFETPSIGSGSYGDYEFVPAGASWTFAGYSGISGNGSMFTSGNSTAPEGTQVAFLEYANSSISQSVSMSAGMYQLGFFAAQRANLQASQQNIEVLIDNTVVGQFTPNSTNYQEYSTAPFTVTAGSHTIKILGLDSAGGNNTVLIDDVQMVAATIAAGQFADYGFESPAVGSGAFDDFEYEPAYSAWQFTGPSGVAGNGSGYTASNPNAPEGTQVGYLQMANASISQEVSLSAGTYNLSFFAAQRMWDQANQDFEVLLDGNVIGTFSPSGTNYYQYSTNAFTVTAGVHTFEFLSLDTAGGDNTALIDNVQINSVAVGQFADAGFETPSVGTGSFNDFATDPSGTAWTFAGAAGVAGNGSGYTSANPNAPQGTQVGLLQMANASISQQVSLAAGTYSVSFFAAQRMWDQANQNFEVLMDGTVIGTFSPSGTNYYQYSTDAFTVSAGVHTFEFLSLDTAGGDNTALIDSVQINTIPVGQFADSGFENPSVGTGSFNDFATDPSGTGWIFAGAAGVAGNGSGYTASNPNAPEGTQVALLQMADASISQEVSLSAGTYNLSFYAAQRMWDQANQDFQVLMDGTVIGTFSPSGTNYYQYSTNAFTVAAGVHSFEFLSLDTAGGDNTALIDNVQINSVAVGQFADAGFETPSVGTGSFNDFATDPSGTGWIFAGAAGVAGNGSGYTSANPNAPQGTQVGYLQMANASISQQVSLASGTYQISFQAAQRMWDQANQDFELLVDGVVVSTFIPSGTSYQTYTSNSFTLSAGVHTFEFLSLDTAGGDNTALIDNVQITSA